MARGVINGSDDVLVTCGGGVDRAALLTAGLAKVTITNVDTSTEAAAYAPYQWQEQNAEHLTFADESFDFVIAHSGLHHCQSPHAALLEMYRVARKGLLVFEPRDGLLVRIGVRLGFGQEYELAAVVANKLRAGGVANTAVPNYVYRWTAREVEKAIKSFAPHLRHRFEFYPLLRVPCGSLELSRKRMRLHILRIISTLLRNAATVLPCFANNLAFLVLKPPSIQGLQPWLTMDGGSVVLNERFIAKEFRSLVQPESQISSGHATK